MGFLVCLQKSRVTVDVFAETFANDQVGLGNVNGLSNLGIFGVLHAMVRPHHLIAVGDLDRFERLFAMGRSE